MAVADMGWKGQLRGWYGYSEVNLFAVALSCERPHFLASGSHVSSLAGLDPLLQELKIKGSGKLYLRNWRVSDGSGFIY